MTKTINAAGIHEISAFLAEHHKKGGEHFTADMLRAWQAHMGYTYDTAAAALGVSRAAYADWLAGRSRTTGKPIKISRLVELACAALAAGLELR